MKTTFFLVAALAIPAAAQTKPNPTGPTKLEVDTFASIDPKALKMLARLAKTYQLSASYRGVVELRLGDEGKTQNVTRFRFSLEDNRGKITKATGKEVERWVSDGNRTLATAKNKPRQYVLQPLSGDRSDQNLALFNRAGWEGAIPNLLTGRMGRFLLEPDLRSLTLQPTSESGAAHKVVIEMKSSKSELWGTITLFIAEDLTLRRAITRSNDTMPGAIVRVWDERCLETFFSPVYESVSEDESFEIYASPHDGKDTFSTVPPKGFRRVDSFN